MAASEESSRSPSSSRAIWPWPFRPGKTDRSSPGFSLRRKWTLSSGSSPGRRACLKWRPRRLRSSTPPHSHGVPSLSRRWERNFPKGIGLVHRGGFFSSDSSDFKMWSVARREGVPRARRLHPATRPAQSEVQSTEVHAHCQDLGDAWAPQPSHLGVNLRRRELTSWSKWSSALLVSLIEISEIDNFGFLIPAAAPCVIPTLILTRVFFKYKKNPNSTISTACYHFWMKFFHKLCDSRTCCFFEVSTLQNSFPKLYFSFIQNREDFNSFGELGLLGESALKELPFCSYFLCSF